MYNGTVHSLNRRDMWRSLSSLRTNTMLWTTGASTRFAFPWRVWRSTYVMGIKCSLPFSDRNSLTFSSWQLKVRIAYHGEGDSVPAEVRVEKAGEFSGFSINR